MFGFAINRPHIHRKSARPHLHSTNYLHHAFSAYYAIFPPRPPPSAPTGHKTTLSPMHTATCRMWQQSSGIFGDSLSFHKPNHNPLIRFVSVIMPSAHFNTSSFRVRHLRNFSATVNPQSPSLHHPHPNHSQAHTGYAEYYGERTPIVKINEATQPLPLHL